MPKNSIRKGMALACALNLVACSGSTGITGEQGSMGDQGAAGAQGAQGDPGATGPAGAAGAAGANGKDGTNGTNGTNGNNGNNGNNGTNGTNGTNGSGSLASDAAAAFKTATPIKHVVVIFQENVSFDHYFATYPVAQNLAGETPFTGVDAGFVNSLRTPLDPTNNFAQLTSLNLLNSNPNSPSGSGGAKNGASAQNPFRLTPADAATADQNHDYTAEQQAFDNSLMDLFPFYTGTANSGPVEDSTPPLNTTALVMGYYDGNTVTGIWNYAQHFAMNDNSFDTMFGPSAPGAINLVTGQTNGIANTNVATSGTGTNLDGDLTNDGNGGATLTSDAQPLGDACSSRDAVELAGTNVGDLLNAAGVSWGFFQGGFDLTITNPNGTTGCKRTTTSQFTTAFPAKTDYIPHHQPFQYYASTRNTTHARPSSVASIGNTFEADGKTVDPANHQYDLHDFFDALAVGNFPAVVYLKAAGYQDGHAGYSTPLDEQMFLAEAINLIEASPEWSSTVIMIMYDDSDGWYDHQMSPIVNPSTATSASANVTLGTFTVAGNPDALNSAGVCNTSTAQQGGSTPAKALPGTNGTANAQGRCGYGPRLPFLVISPYAKPNYIDHTLTDQTSSLRFIEDNWLGKQRITGSFDALAGDITSAGSMLNIAGGPVNGALFLNPTTGQPQACPTCL